MINLTEARVKRKALVAKAEDRFESYAAMVRWSMSHRPYLTNPLHIAQTEKAYRQFLAAFNAL